MLPLFWSAAYNWAAPVEVFPIASPVNEAPGTVASIVESAPPVPCRDRAVEIVENELCLGTVKLEVRRRARGDPRRGGAHLSRRSIGAARGCVSLVRDSHKQLHTGGARGLRATHTVDRRSPRPTEVGSLVGNPERACGREGQPPGVLQVRVGLLRRDRAVRDEVRLDINIPGRGAARGSHDRVARGDLCRAHDLEVGLAMLLHDLEVDSRDRAALDIGDEQLGRVTLVIDRRGPWPVEEIRVGVRVGQRLDHFAKAIDDLERA